MALQKMGNFTFNHVNQTDELGLTADEAKEKFDSRGEELKTALNNAVDALNATADGNSGADNVGATPVEGWPGSSVQAIMESAKSDIAGHKAVAAVQAHLAKNIAIEDTGGLFTATHVEGALGELFTSVSNGKDAVAAAITDKGVPTSGSDSFSQMADNIDSIVLGSGNAVEADVLSGKTFSNDSGTGKIGTMPNRGAVSQSLAVNGSYTIPQGYHNGAGQVTQSIATKGAATITPSTVNQVIAANQYLTGAQTIAGSANLAAANIKEGVNIFNVIGTLPGVQKASVSISSYSFTNRQFEMEHSDSVDYITDNAQDLSVSLSFVPNFIYVRGGFIFLNDGIYDRALVGGSGYGERYYWLKVNVPTDKCVIITQSRLYLPISGIPGDVFYVYRLPF